MGSRIGLRAGFTLTEMLVTLAIIGMVTGMSVTQLRSFTTHRRIQAYGLQIAGIIQSAQLESLLKGKETYVDDNYIQAARDATSPQDKSNALSRDGDLTVVVEKPLRILVDGACTPGEIRLRLENFSYALGVGPLACQTTFTRLP